MKLAIATHGRVAWFVWTIGGSFQHGTDTARPVGCSAASARVGSVMMATVVWLDAGRERDMTGAELAAIRKVAGLSQTELSKRAGVSRHAVSYWE